MRYHDNNGYSKILKKTDFKIKSNNTKNSAKIIETFDSFAIVYKQCAKNFQMCTKRLTRIMKGLCWRRRVSFLLFFLHEMLQLITNCVKNWSVGFYSRKALTNAENIFIRSI